LKTETPIVVVPPEKSQTLPDIPKQPESETISVPKQPSIEDLKQQLIKEITPIVEKKRSVLDLGLGISGEWDVIANELARKKEREEIKRRKEVEEEELRLKQMEDELRLEEEYLNQYGASLSEKDDYSEKSGGLSESDSEDDEDPLGRANSKPPGYFDLYRDTLKQKGIL